MTPQEAHEWVAAALFAGVGLALLLAEPVLRRMDRCVGLERMEGEPMTRPMPGPPTYSHYPNYYPHRHPDDALGLCPGCDIDDQADRASSAKHLTDAECAAEYWRSGWIADHDFHDEREADEASTWHRFASLPHAFKETPQ